jgi:hypothetical protein
MAENPYAFQVGGAFNSTVGPAIASAATVAPTAGIHSVTGTAAIVNITVPWPGFTGSITFLPTAIWTWTAAGNIQTAGTTTAATSPVTFTFDGSKWWANRLS